MINPLLNHQNCLFRFILKNLWAPRSLIQPLFNVMNFNKKHSKLHKNWNISHNIKKAENSSFPLNHPLHSLIHIYSIILNYLMPHLKIPFPFQNYNSVVNRVNSLPNLLISTRGNSTNPSEWLPDWFLVSEILNEY